jgi:hypothetical protein
MNRACRQAGMFADERGYYLKTLVEIGDKIGALG